jgi:hypothetical protein
MDKNSNRAAAGDEPLRILLDAGVVLGAVGSALCGDAPTLLELARRGRIHAFVGAGALAIAYDELAREEGHAVATQRLRELRAHVDVATVDAAVVDDALGMDWPDLEPALTQATARRAGLDLILSLTPDDFLAASPPTIDPAALIARIGEPAQTA